uniref:C2H2-type domain-containing protein n=1 Tax=Ornithorhynchus anatinus TaxID=9258 RepID=A0A6I8N098_ORNAN
MASVLSRRLGKRSLLGARVSAPGAAGEGQGLAELAGLVPPHPLPQGKDCVGQDHPLFPGPQLGTLLPGQKVSDLMVLGRILCARIGGRRSLWARVWGCSMGVVSARPGTGVMTREVGGVTPGLAPDCPQTRPLGRRWISSPARPGIPSPPCGMGRGPGGTGQTGTPSLDLAQLGSQVLVPFEGQEWPALVELAGRAEDEVTVLLLERGLRVSCKGDEVRPAEPWAGPPRALPPERAAPLSTALRSVSRNIDVPRRRSDAVEMDEMMAAMVLTSLSCSPGMQSPPSSENPARASYELWKDGGDVSDGGSSTSSGHWSVGSGISTPSPPRREGSPKHAGSPPADDGGFDTDPNAFLLEEPAPRKRKNSVKLLYKCLWPGCGKVLRSIVGIKRHVKTQHLGDGADSDQRKREEDFYYTDVQVKEEAVPAAAEPAPGPSLGSPGLPPPPLPKPETPALESPLPLDKLSKSAPGSFWHIQADHAYQALPSVQIPVSPHIFTSISWAAATSSIPALSPVSASSSQAPAPPSAPSVPTPALVRSQTLSPSDPGPPPPPPPPPPPALLKSPVIVASPPRVPSSTRKVRGDAKKCRKVYGIERREQWCTACRWKKACQRFLD